MTSEMQLFVRSNIQELHIKIATAIIEKQIILSPTSDVYYRHEITSPLEFGESGYPTFQSQIKLVNKHNWGNTIDEIRKMVSSSAEYQAIDEVVRQKQIQSYRNVMEVLCDRISFNILRDSDPKDKEVQLESIINTFIKHLNDEPIDCFSRAYIEGVKFVGDPLSLRINNVQMLLRGPVKTDFESESIWFMNKTDFPPRSSCILEIILPTKRPYEVQKEVARSISILQLFKSGGVKYHSYTMESESMIEIIGGTTFSGRGENPFVMYEVNNNDVPVLMHFWQEIVNYLVESIYENSGKENHPINIAYHRYTSALLKIGLLEERIANVVMGFEALFLTGEEQGEISYRLRIRTAKVFGLIGDNPEQVKNIINLAYSVRSSYVHGDAVSKDSLKKINRDFQDLKSFLSQLLNKLRIALILNIIVQNKLRLNKQDFIKLIDDSFIDRKKNVELRKLIREVKRTNLINNL